MVGDQYRKREFTYQRFILRNFFSVIAGGVGMMLFILMVEKFLNGHCPEWICVVSIFVCNVIFYKYTQTCNLFLEKGEYWVENGVVTIKSRKKVYNLTDVNVLLGIKFSACGLPYTKVGMLKIDNGKKTITLISPSNNDIKKFSDSELFSLFETILENNPQLKKDDELEFGYEIEK